MELAGQWRREWAGTAEYGKVIEGGVTRQVARAMEVLHASGPGAKVRVMRAAYHSSSGPGIPASSYMLHSSRRVISSGFNLLESPTYPSKPLEISSTPLESSPECNTEVNNYKVTEPDDTEISEPSKWRGISSGNPLRMPSEESSSTDNTSIIDLDSRSSVVGIHRKYSFDSENSENNFVKRSSTRASPLLDPPVTLSTLKYKSLLNGSNDWNNRRKSYSFEDTCPLNEVILQSNDTLAMESSTDSGICKSTEIVNDNPEDTQKIFEREHKSQNSANSFDQWHINKPNSFYKGSKYKSYKEHNIVVEDPLENKITLQSAGKVSITVPVTLESDNNFSYYQTNDDDKRVKRVGFCKTELHFAAESGKVNIIATDEKPPPTNDFRKRRSAFVPINDRFEKPVTLFGERTEFLEPKTVDEYNIRDYSESMEYEENTAATKSILKNKIPKPKPYLLGENMVFGDKRNESIGGNLAPSGVSLINNQLRTNRDSSAEETPYSISTVYDRTFKNSLRTANKCPLRYQSSDSEKNDSDDKSLPEKQSNSISIRNKFNGLHMSPVHKAKTRQLRESELAYFGIDNRHKNMINDERTESAFITQSRSKQSQKNFIDEDFASVRLVKNISNSSQNSEAESDDSPEYQNLPLKNNFAPIPTPRSRVKYKTPDEGVAILKPIIEQVTDITPVSHESRRSRNKKQDVTIPPIRSLSEPDKKRTSTVLQRNAELRSSIRENNSQRYKDNKRNENKETCKKLTPETKKNQRTSKDSEYEAPLYININKDINIKKINNKYNGSNNYHDSVITSPMEKNTAHTTRRSDNDTNLKREKSVKNNCIVQVHRTEKLSTPEYQRNKETKNLNKPHKECNNTIMENISISTKHRNKSSSRPNKGIDNIINSDEKKSTLLQVKTNDGSLRNSEVNHKSKYRTSNKNGLLKKIEQPIIEHDIRLKAIKTTDNEGEKHSGNSGRKTSRRSEYVIKYDDKNGTVSSISKVRGGHSASRQRHVSKERNKEHSKESKTNNKNVEKSGLPPRQTKEY